MCGKYNYLLHLNNEYIFERDNGIPGEKFRMKKNRVMKN